MNKNLSTFCLHSSQILTSLKYFLLSSSQADLEKGMTKDEMVGWRHQLNRLEFGQTPGDGEGQGSLAYCSPWGHKELDVTEQLNKCMML